MFMFIVTIGVLALFAIFAIWLAICTFGPVRDVKFAQGKIRHVARDSQVASVDMNETGETVLIDLNSYEALTFSEGKLVTLYRFRIPLYWKQIDWMLFHDSKPTRVPKHLHPNSVSALS